jgi:hypothetical protein
MRLVVPKRYVLIVWRIGAIKVCVKWNLPRRVMPTHRGDRRWGWGNQGRACRRTISLKYDVLQLTLAHQVRLKAMAKSFRGVVFHGVRDIRVEDRPFPIRETLLDTDAVVKVTSAGIGPSMPPLLMSRIMRK